MRIVVAVLACSVVAAAPMSGQAAGDSIRFRIPPSSVWTHARFVSVDSAQLMVSEAEHNQSYPLPIIGRLEVRRRKPVLATILGSTVACALGAVLGNAVRPKDGRPLFGSNGANVAVAAGFGLAVGLIEISVSPWHWQRVRVGLKASP
jgi:hypothetical protein